ncbi:hypothetical protein P3G55_15350 [Leptospira sp. 96542]|nr:hypothetical protein [Leptospira sp. 96542]
MKYFFLILSLIFFQRCSIFEANSSSSFKGYHHTEGYLRFRVDIGNGRFVIKSKIFANLDNCYNQNNCNVPESIEIYDNLPENFDGYFFSLNEGDYFGITKITVLDWNFWSCQSTEILIFHGFAFDPKKKFGISLYEGKECVKGDDGVTYCPKINIKRAQTNILNLKEDPTYSTKISVNHLISRAELFPFIFMYCGPISYKSSFESINYGEMK